MKGGSLYRPHIDRAITGYEQIVHRHAQDLASCELIWEQVNIEDDSGEVIASQLLPRYIAHFKGAI